MAWVGWERINARKYSCNEGRREVGGGAVDSGRRMVD